MIMTKEGVWGHPPLPGWLPEQHHAVPFVDLDEVSAYQDFLTVSVKVTHILIFPPALNLSLPLEMPLKT